MKLNTINFHLTNKCNLICKHCLYDSGVKNIPEMKTAKIIEIIRDFAKASKNKGTVNLYGGETLLMKDIFKIIKSAQDERLKVGITTNVNVPNKTLEKVAKMKVSRITVDIDGGNASTHDLLRNKNGHFEQSKKAIEYFRKEGLFVSVNSVLHKKNIREVELILELCKTLGVNLVSFYLFTPLGRGWNIKSQLLEPKEWIDARKRVVKWIKINHPGFSVIWEKSYAKSNTQNEKKLCDGLTSQVIDVRCDGRVYYCGLLISVDGNSFGDLKKENIKGVLKNRKARGFTDDIGCSALAIQNEIKTGTLTDPRKKESGLVPVCPYDWEVLSGAKSKIHNKFVHVDDN